MGKKISLISLVESNSALISHAQHRIVEIALSFSPDSGNFAMHNNAKEMLKSLSNAFSDSSVVIVGTDCSRFLSLKRMLLQALSLEGEPNSEIVDIISKNSDKADESQVLSHALVPKDSTVFVSDDGFYSGFSTKSGNQYLIVLPLDPGRIDSIIENGFYAYLKLITAGSVDFPNEMYEDDYASKTVNKLLSAGLKVAIASTKTSVYIKSIFKDIPDYDDAFEFVDCDVEKSNMTQKEFVANLAHQARENSACELGAAISNVFTSEKENGRLFVFVTVADSLHARVAKVFNEPGETPRMLVDAAIITLLNMLANYAQEGGFSGFPNHDNEADTPLEEVKTKKKIALRLMLSGLIALLLCLATIFFSARVATAIRNNSKDGNRSGITYVLSHNPTETSDNTTYTGIYRQNYVYSSTTTALETAITTQTIISTSKPLNTTILPIITTTKPKITTTKIIITTVKPTVTATKRPTATKAPATTTKAPVTTTKAPVTTTKAPVTTTKSPVTTTDPPAATTTEISTTEQQSKGSFSFAVKGYGHGVGMSQDGATAYANQGKSYKEILLHYYNINITLVDDIDKPASVSYNGNSIPLITYLARTTAAEIGTGAPLEAIKAQVVAVYTYAKLNNFILSSSNHAYSSSFDIEKDSRIKTAVAAVAGEYLSYSGAVASTPYFASSAGKTVSAESVWGSDKYPYLEGGVASPEPVENSYETFTSDEIRELVEAYNKKSISKNNITLSGNPSEWLEILKADDTGYVEKIRVGDQTMSGNTFRYHLLDSGIRSHCFIVAYNPN